MDPAALHPGSVTELQRAVLQQGRAVGTAATGYPVPAVSCIPSSAEAASLALATLDDAVFEAAARRHAEPAPSPAARAAPPPRRYPATPLRQVPTLARCAAGSKRGREFDELISARSPLRQAEPGPQLGPMPSIDALLRQQRGSAPALQVCEFHAARNALACAQLRTCATKSGAASALMRLLTAVQDAARG